MDLYDDDLMHFGDVWAPEQMFEFNQYDDLKVTEAPEDGLYDGSSKSKPLADAQDDLFQDLFQAPAQDGLGAEWMEQSNWTQYLEVPVTDDGLVAPQPFVQLPEDHSLALNTPVMAVEEEQAEARPPTIDELLHQLLNQQTELMESSVQAVSPVSPAPSSPEAQVAPEIDFTMTNDTGLEDVLDCGKVEFIQSPLSPDDIESLLSSSTASSPSTVDSTNLYDEDGSLICNTSDLYEVVTNDKQKCRGSPYSRTKNTSKSTKSKGRKQTASISPNPSELELELMSKKDRKKLQNKNAAIRYRMKKKLESDQKRDEEDELEDTNKKLHAKVDELTREITYMKNLIRDVRKARGLPPLSS